MKGPKPLDSICLIYSPQQRQKDIATLLARFLADHYCCLCVLSHDCVPDSIEDVAGTDGVLAEAAQGGALAFMHFDDFVSDSKFNAESFWKEVARRRDTALDHGFIGILVTVDVSSMTPNLLRVEADVNTLSTMADGVTICCLYDRTSIEKEILASGLRDHPRLMLNSSLHPNPFYGQDHDGAGSLDDPLALLARLDGGQLAALNGKGEESIRDQRPQSIDVELAPLFIQNVADSLVRVDRDGNILEVNSIAASMWSSSTDDMLGKNVWELHPEAVGSHTYQQVQRSLRENKSAQFETFSSVMDRWIEVSLIPIDDGLWISVRDISKRKQIEETLNQRVRQQAAVAELGRQALDSVDLPSFMNRLVETVGQTLDLEFVELWELLRGGSEFKLVAGVGWTLEEVGSLVIPSNSQSEVGYALEVAGPVIVHDYETENRFRDVDRLSHKGIVSGISVLVSGGDEPYGVLSVHTRERTQFTQDDVNFVQSVANILATTIDHEKAEELQRHYAAIVTSSDDAIIGETLDGLISGWNLAAERVFGYTADEVMGQPVTMLYPDHLYYEMHELLEQIYQGRRVEQHESIRRTKGGRVIDVSVSLSPIRDRMGRIIGASKTARDISERKIAEIERAAVDQRLQLALEAGRMGTWDWNLGTGEVIWSSNMERIHGLESGTFGGTFDDFERSLHPDDRERVMSAINETVESGEDFHVEYRNIRPDGEIQWLDARGRVVQGGRGRSHHMTGVCTDVTQQVESRRQISRFAAAAIAERDRLQQIIDIIPEGIAITDETGRIVVSNQAARHIWGQPVPADDYHGYGVFGVVDPDGTPWETEQLPTTRSLLYGERTVGKQLMLRNATSGELIPLLVNSAPIVDDQGNITGAVTTFQDITSFKEFERQKDEFLQTLSHDLKNPLTSVKGNAQFLRRRAQVANPELLPIVDRIENSAVQAVDLIDELLDLTRLQMGRPVELVRSRTDLVQLVKQLADQQAATSRFHRIRVEAEDALLVGHFDEMRLSRVLSNLINNAIKYSPDNTEILIRVEHTHGDRAWAQIHIQDHGIGIPAADLPRLFERFRRGSNVEGQIRGSGLGLASSKQIVEQHGGHIEVESVEGDGSTFTVHLPLDDMPPVRHTS